MFGIGVSCSKYKSVFYFHENMHESLMRIIFAELVIVFSIIVRNISVAKELLIILSRPKTRLPGALVNL